MHILYRYKKEMKASLSSASALSKTYQTVGVAVVLTSFMLFFGYGSMIFSSLKTAQLFGGLTALTVCSALFSQFVLFPMLLKLMKR